jgi:hypothetical protein
LARANSFSSSAFTITLLGHAEVTIIPSLYFLRISKSNLGFLKNPSVHAISLILFKRTVVMG